MKTNVCTILHDSLIISSQIAVGKSTKCLSELNRLKSHCLGYMIFFLLTTQPLSAQQGVSGNSNQFRISDLNRHWVIGIDPKNGITHLVKCMICMYLRGQVC